MGGVEAIPSSRHRNLLPPSYGRFWEPFLGGGSLFFLLKPSRAVISDSAKPLIETYAAIRDDVDLVIAELLPLRPDKDTFYRVRAASPQTSAARAARFIYLKSQLLERALPS